MSKNLLENYCKKIDELAPATFNEDQKILAKKILEKADEKDLQNIFQMLIQRIKIGFTFDVAPTYQKEDEQSVALLKKDENRSFKNYENTSNIENTLIIGENYDALKNLLVVERERERESSSRSDAYYDVIYIDPPYNTESAKDDGNHLADEKSDIAPSKFVYRDKFSRNGWLNMLNERLRLAKQLLKDDGVIFVSIDDNEQAYLKVLMDEIFGEENFVAVLSRETKTGGGRFGNQLIQKDFDFVISYVKNMNKILKFSNFSSEWDDYKFSDERGKYTLKHPLDGGVGQPNYQKTLYFNNKTYKPREGRNWSFNDERVEWLFLNNFLVFKNNGMVYVKNYKDYEIEKYDNKYTLIKKENGVSWSSSRLINKTYNNANGKKNLLNLGITNFNYPKPVSLLRELIKMNANKNARILDFYAGSGTTGHAVMELNKEDDGKRTYTLVTNNENNIGYDVCYERLYRINNGVGTNNETFEWTNKNKPYNQNLNVFSIDYYDTSILKKDDNDSITKIRNALAKEIEEFGITPSANFNVDIYYDLLSLKPILKGDK